MHFWKVIGNYFVNTYYVCLFEIMADKSNAKFHYTSQPCSLKQIDYVVPNYYLKKNEIES